MEASQQPQSAPLAPVARMGSYAQPGIQPNVGVGAVLASQAFDIGHTEQHVLRSGMKVTVHFSAQPSGDTYHALARLMKFKGEDFDAQEAPPSVPPFGPT